MKKSVKTLGIAAALAAVIPLTAYAATSSGTSSDAASGTQSGSATVESKIDYRGWGHFGIVSQEVLDVLKLDQAAFQAKVKEGKTLAEIAEEQGVSRDSLKQALSESFNAKIEEQKKQFGENLDTMIDSKFQEIGFGKHRGFGGHMFGGGDLSAAAEVLGLTNEELKEALISGKSLADVAKEKGVEVQKVIDAQVKALTERINQAVTDGKLTAEQAEEQISKLTEKVEDMVNGTGFMGGRGHKGFGGPGREIPPVDAGAGDATGTSTNT
ncbi:sigma-70 family RNA polymerase sigma factor [Paenibacillus alkalitolerans]|uniref:sigma-70 family RNA polymerase sigma factor n=1 Tax=Paenibacillus alkalitolerans TaxID=2799335 RepID=UPI0018F670CC|nr:sigma-70 family RNA polymerase sigma factor [Paenibacillus alkalitolerans]